MKEERTNAEKRFWRTLYGIAQEAGFEPEWEHLGYNCPQRKIHELIERFQADPGSAGFYGIRVPMGEVSGLQLSLIIENQKDLVIGIQAEDTPESINRMSLSGMRDLMVSLNRTGRSWDFDAPGWLAWKTPEIHLNFRSLFNRAFLDILLHKTESEALYLIGEEISDILKEARIALFNQYVEYGALAG